MIQGRPIRFLISIVGGWMILRFAMLSSVFSDSVVQPLEKMTVESQGGGNWTGRTALAGEVRGTGPNAIMSVAGPKRQGLRSNVQVSAFVKGHRNAHFPERYGALPLNGSSLDPTEHVSVDRLAPGEMGGFMAERASETHGWATDRWAGGAWLLWRRDGDPGQARLGGAQAGVRVDYLLVRSSPLRPSIYGRVSTALHGVAAAEVAVGVAIRPNLPFPVIVAVERREAASPGGRSDFAVLAAGGVNPVPVGLGFWIDGYGQAGFVGIDRRDGFADGRLTLERPVAGDIAVGAAIWGGVQPGASRLDIGPQASMRMRVGGANMRIGAEWRARVAGHAAPSSGPALSFGTDF